jgi:hypothetical protein
MAVVVLKPRFLHSLLSRISFMKGHAPAGLN